MLKKMTMVFLCIIMEDAGQTGNEQDTNKSVHKKFTKNLLALY